MALTIGMTISGRAAVRKVPQQRAAKLQDRASAPVCSIIASISDLLCRKEKIDVLQERYLIAGRWFRAALPIRFSNLLTRVGRFVITRPRR